METAARQGLGIFEDLFFFGSLADRCTISWATLGPHILGQTSLPPGASRCDIELDIKFTRDSAFDTILLLSTLIHEMCHAFLLIYACDVSGCREKRAHSGETGHGSAWEAMAVAVDRTALRAFSMNPDLGISYCTSLEGDSTLPSGCRFPRLEEACRETVGRLDKHMEEFHAHDSSESSTSDNNASTTYSGSKGIENRTGAPTSGPFSSKDRFSNDLYSSKLKELEGCSTKDRLDAFSSKAK